MLRESTVRAAARGPAEDARLLLPCLRRRPGRPDGGGEAIPARGGPGEGSGVDRRGEEGPDDCEGMRGVPDDRLPGDGPVRVLSMDLLGDDELERSAVVANCRMNRVRGLTGSNGYGVEIGFDPLNFLRVRMAESREAAWLDLCCGSGKALIEAARI